MESNHYNAQQLSFPLNEKNINLPDYRQTLYWNPNIQITGKKKVTLEFYTSDLESVYNIDVQGITQNGIPLQSNILFEVIK